MNYTKPIIKQLRKGIRVGEIMTPEQEELLEYYAIPLPDLPSFEKVRFVQNKIDVILRAKSRKKAGRPKGSTRSNK